MYFKNILLLYIAIIITQVSSLLPYHRPYATTKEPRFIFPQDYDFDYADTDDESEEDTSKATNTIIEMIKMKLQNITSQHDLETLVLSLKNVPTEKTPRLGDVNVAQKQKYKVLHDMDYLMNLFNSQFNTAFTHKDFDRAAAKMKKPVYLALEEVGVVKAVLATKNKRQLLKLLSKPPLVSPISWSYYDGDL